RSSNTHYRLGDFYYADETPEGKYRLYQVVSLQENPGGNGFWQALTAYNVGDVVKANGHKYRCVFDGRLTLPNQTVIENIVTNMKAGGDVFSFYKGTDVPTKLGSSGKWIIKVGNLDQYRFKDGPYFGHEGNPVPEILDANDYAKKWDIPTKVGQLENDVGFAITSQVPTKVSQLENDAGYAVSRQVPTKVSQLENDAEYVRKSELPSTGA
ncbi:carbohydrate-binding protein, partial [uncultured Selenomonas sp.]|uniref:carbohydrate-binding protein n=1 Tax=uncultured Selenomonas sp. TaxID=159275 RepID=UPI0028EEA1B2